MKVFKPIFLGLFFVLILSFFTLVNADLQGNATQISDGIKLDWNSIDGVELYRIDYGNTSGNYTESVDFLEETTYTFNNLNNGLYYFSIIGYDNLGRESFKSQEITSSISISGPLFVVESEMVDENKVEVTFSNNISTTQGSDFIIESVLNNNDFYDVIEIKINSDNSKKIIIVLDGKPTVGDEYRVVVLSILDEFNQNIEFGVDSETFFTAKSNFDLDYIYSDFYFGKSLENNQNNQNNPEDENNQNNPENQINPEDENNQNNPENQINYEDENNQNNPENQINYEDENNPEDENIELNSAEEKNISTTNIGVEVNSENINSNLLNVASESDKLPQTGPAEILLLILALIFGGFIFLNRYKKS